MEVIDTQIDNKGPKIGLWGTPDNTGSHTE